MMKLENLARDEYDKNADDRVRDELELADAHVVELPDAMNGEVKTRYIGKAGLWRLTRAWSYWIAEGPDGEALSMKHALEVFRREKEKGWKIRAFGDGCDIDPRQMASRRGDMSVGCYHIDTLNGLKAFVRAAEGGSFAGPDVKGFEYIHGAVLKKDDSADDVLEKIKAKAAKEKCGGSFYVILPADSFGDAKALFVVKKTGSGGEELYDLWKDDKRIKDGADLKGIAEASCGLLCREEDGTRYAIAAYKDFRIRILGIAGPSVMDLKETMYRHAVGYAAEILKTDEGHAGNLVKQDYSFEEDKGYFRLPDGTVVMLQAARLPA